MTELWIYRVGVPLCRVLPLKFLYWVALRVADICHARDHEGRAAVIRNLKQIFRARGIEPAENTLSGFSRKVYQYFGKNCVDFFRYSHLTREDIHRMISVERADHLEAASQAGKGVIVVTAHFGNWELGGSVLAAMDYKVTTVVLPQRLEKLNEIYQSQRKRHGLKIIPLGGSPIGLVRCLRRGEVVALLADRDFTAHGEPYEFFGRPARLPRGPAWLSHKTGAPIVVGTLPRLVDDSFLLRMHPPIWPKEHTSEAAIQDQVCKTLEREIGSSAYQWFIFDDFWTEDATANGAS